MPDVSHYPVSRFGAPFRVGSTSYVYPADILPNVERLAEAGDVDDIELILFEVDDGPNNLPGPEVVARLAEIARAHGLTYTVHLPLDLRLGAEGGAQHASLLKAERVIKATRPLEPFAYVFHLDGEGVGEPDWTSRALRALDVMITWVGRPELLAVENLENYDPTALDPILDALPMSRTVDIGHLWKMGRDPLDLLDAWLPRTRVIHLHGMSERDHKSLAMTPPERLDPVVAKLMDYHGVVTLEVFDTDDFFTSRDALLASVTRVASAARAAHG